MAKIHETLRTYYPNGVAVGASAGIALVDSDGNVVSGSGGITVAGTTSVTGTEAISTSFTTITSVVATLESDASLTANAVSATWTGGTVTLKVWKPTATGDCTPIAATTAKDVSYIITGN